MKKCADRFGDFCDSDKLVQIGPVSDLACDKCPFFREEVVSKDFFVATAQLTRSKQKRGEIKISAKPCGDCSEKDSAAKKKLDRVLRKPIKENGEWTVAITTAPRRNCTLVECVDSVRRAGWEPIIFAEPGSTETDAQTINNSTRLGVWHNWLNSAKWCLQNTTSDLILTVQDDSIFHPDSRVFAESVLWPGPRAAFVSLYTPKHYSTNSVGDDRPAGINKITTRSLWGACALIWDRRVLRAVVNHKTAKNWLGAATRSRKHNKQVRERRAREPWTIANSDTAIGKICNALKRPMYFADPSPVSHVAVHSTIGHGGNKGRRNCYRCADHKKPLEDQIPRPKRIHMLGKSTFRRQQGMSYDELYKSGGFRYSRGQQLPRLKQIVDRLKISGRVLDAPCGDGFWSRLLEELGCKVTSTDLSPVGAKKAGGVVWNLEEFNPDWENSFDWVFCRGVSHVHNEPMKDLEKVVDNLVRYAKNVVMIYSTSQTSKDSGNHFNHTQAALDKRLKPYGGKSFMVGSFWHYVISN